MYTNPPSHTVRPGGWLVGWLVDGTNVAESERQTKRGKVRERSESCTRAERCDTERAGGYKIARSRATSVSAVERESGRVAGRQEEKGERGPPTGGGFGTRRNWPAIAQKLERSRDPFSLFSPFFPTDFRSIYGGEKTKTFPKCIGTKQF